jgi:hypothetical protein
MVQYPGYSTVNMDCYGILKTDNILPFLLAYVCVCVCETWTCTVKVEHD